MLRNGTKFVTDLPVREAGHQMDPRCANFQVSEMTCNFVGAWVPDVRVIHYLVARMKKNGEQLKESHSQII